MYPESKNACNEHESIPPCIRFCAKPLKVRFKLENSIFTNCRGFENNPYHKCNLREYGTSEVVIWGQNVAYIGKVPNIVCGNNLARPKNVVLYCDHIAVGDNDYIKVTPECIVLGTRPPEAVTESFGYAYTKMWHKPGYTSMKIRQGIIDGYFNEMRSTLTSNKSYKFEAWETLRPLLDKHLPSPHKCDIIRNNLYIKVVKELKKEIKKLADELQNKSFNSDCTFKIVHALTDKYRAIKAYLEKDETVDNDTSGNDTDEKCDGVFGFEDAEFLDQRYKYDISLQIVTSSLGLWLDSALIPYKKESDEYLLDLIAKCVYNHLSNCPNPVNQIGVAFDGTWANSAKPEKIYEILKNDYKTDLKEGGIELQVWFSQFLHQQHHYQIVLSQH